jgi:hypothetical protein
MENFNDEQPELVSLHEDLNPHPFDDNAKKSVEKMIKSQQIQKAQEQAKQTEK